MASGSTAYDAMHPNVACEPATIYDLYGLLGVSPDVKDAGLRDALERIIRQAQPSLPNPSVSLVGSNEEQTSCHDTKRPTRQASTVLVPRLAENSP